jgi:hypothetical protein
MVTKNKDVLNGIVNRTACKFPKMVLKLKPGKIKMHWKWNGRIVISLKALSN